MLCQSYVNNSKNGYINIGQFKISVTFSVVAQWIIFSSWGSGCKWIRKIYFVTKLI